jgi:hypothetical protein
MVKRLALLTALLVCGCSSIENAPNKKMPVEFGQSYIGTVDGCRIFVIYGEDPNKGINPEYPGYLAHCKDGKASTRAGGFNGKFGHAVQVVE